LRWNALQASPDLLDDAAHGLGVGLGMIDHPLGKGLAIDILGHDVEIVAFARTRPRLEHMGAVDTAAHPLFHHEPLQVVRIAAQIDRGNLDYDRSVAVAVDREIEVAAAAGVNLSHDAVAVEQHTRLQERREGPIGLLGQ